MKDQAFQIVGVTRAEYVEWCKAMKRPVYKLESKQEFFDKIRTGRIVRDASTGKLTVKRVKHK